MRQDGQTRGRSGCDQVEKGGMFSAMSAITSEIIFEVTEAEEGGYCARALGYSIFTEADTIDNLRQNVKEAADCYFDETMEAPRIIRLHFVRDGVMAR